DGVDQAARGGARRRRRRRRLAAGANVPRGVGRARRHPRARPREAGGGRDPRAGVDRRRRRGRAHGRARRRVRIGAVVHRRGRGRAGRGGRGAAGVVVGLAHRPHQAPRGGAQDARAAPPRPRRGAGRARVLAVRARPAPGRGAPRRRAARVAQEGRVTRRGLLALSLAVGALATAVALDRPRRAAPDEPGRFFPGLAPASVRRIEIRAPSRPPLVLERTSEELTLPGLPTDRDAVRDLVASLALLASRRRAPAGPGHGLETPRLEVGVTDDKGTRVLLVGNREPALGRVWAALRCAPEHHLVDDWAARAVDRTADDLRRRAPFAGGDVASVRLEAGGTTIDIAGRPAGVAVPGGRALADHRKLAALIGRIEELRALRF